MIQRWEWHIYDLLTVYWLKNNIHVDLDAYIQLSIPGTPFEDTQKWVSLYIYCMLMFARS